MNIYIYISYLYSHDILKYPREHSQFLLQQVKLVTVVEGDQEAPL